MQEVWGSNPHSSTQVRDMYQTLVRSFLRDQVAVSGSSTRGVGPAEQQLQGPYGVSG